MNTNASFDDLALSFSNRLVESIIRRGVSKFVAEAFSHVPRHFFIEKLYMRDPTAPQWRLAQPTDVEAWLESIYADELLVIAIDEIGRPASTSTAPWLMALMLEALHLGQGLKVLEVGTGTGYNAALLTFLVRNPSLVFSVEIDSELAQRAEQNLQRVVGKGVTVHVGNGLDGYRQSAPYDRIIATASYHKVPPVWLDQLQQGGILVMNLRGSFAGGILRLEKKRDDARDALGRFLNTPHIGCLALKDPSQAPTPGIADSIGRCSRGPLVVRTALSQDVFDPSMLREFDFLFFLQFEFPEAHLAWLSAAGPGIAEAAPCLIDNSSQTMVRFYQTKHVAEWAVDVQGQYQVWDRLTRTYRCWLDLGRPRPTDYVLEIDDTGRQSVKILHPAAEGCTPIWVLD